MQNRFALIHLLVLASIGLSDSPASAAEPEVPFPQGAFQSAYDDGRPDGWEIPEYLKDAFSLRDEKERRFLRLNWPHVGYVTPECRVEIDPSWKAVKVSMNTRVVELKGEADGTAAFEFRYDFLDKAGETLHIAKPWPAIKEPGEWKLLESECDVPEGAALLKLWPSLLSGAGVIDFADITVEVKTRDDSKVDKFRVVPPKSAKGAVAKRVAKGKAPAPEPIAPKAAATPTPADAAERPFQNSGFEGAYIAVPKTESTKAQIDGEIAPGWSDDSAWAEVSIAYARDTVNASGGEASQRMEVRSVGAGAAQLSQDVKLRKGRVYHISAQLRSSTNTGGELFLRQSGSPYHIYGRGQIRISPEWRKFEVYARGTADADAKVIFVPTGPGVYWIDDVEFKDVTDVLATFTDSMKGNLLPNASFEAGLADGWHMRVGGFDNSPLWATKAHRDVQCRIDRTSAAAGQASVAVTLDDWMIGTFTSPLTAVRFGQTYTASISMKADRPTTVGFSLDDTNAAKDLEIGTEWKRYTITGVAQSGIETRLRVRCIVRDAGVPVTFWLDGATLEEGTKAVPEYLAAFPVEIGLSVQRPGSIFFDGESAVIQVSTAVADGTVQPANAKVRWTIEDLSGRVTELPATDLSATSLTIPPNSDAPRGLFKVRGQVVAADGTPLSNRTERIFARLPRPRELTAEQAKNSYFGAHVDLQPEKFKIARAVGVRWIRMHDGTSASLWGTVEPKPGQWNFNDAGVKAAREAGLHVLGMLGGAPGWASNTPVQSRGYFSNWNLPDAPGAKEKWEEYVRRTVKHFQPLIDAWEIWNEPYINGASDAFFPNGAPELYCDLMRRGAAAARATNPAVKLVGICGPASDDQWLERVLSTAGPEHYDFISFHGYGNRLQGGEKTQFATYVENIHRAQSRHGTPKPVWNTEGGPNDNVSWYNRDAADVRFQMTPLVRIDVAQMAAGVQKFFPYSMHGDPEHRAGTHMMLEHDRSIKPIVAARAVLASYVDGAEYGGRTTPTDGVEAHAFRLTNGKTVEVVWSVDGKSHTCEVPQGRQAVDVLGNLLPRHQVVVGEEPIYLVQN